MATYEVTTEQGTFEVTTDLPFPNTPEGQAQLQVLAEQQMREGTSFGQKVVQGSEVLSFAKDVLQKGVKGTVGEMVATGGAEFLGQLGGGALGARVGLPKIGATIGGSLASGLGLAGQRVLTGQGLPSLGEVGAEMGFSAVGETAAMLLKRAKQAFPRGTPQAQIVRRTEAAEVMRTSPQEIFLAPEKATVTKLFDDVRASGEQIVLNDVAKFLDDFRVTGAPGKIGEIQREIRALDRLNKTGGRWDALFTRLKAGSAVDDIGDLQQLHSQIRKLTEAGGEFEAVKLMRDFNREIDNAIFSGLKAAPASPNAQKLLEARRGWARLRATEELDDFIEDNIDTTSDAVFDMFSLNRFSTALRRGRTRAAQAVNRSLKATPGAEGAMKKVLADVQPLFATIEKSIASDVSGIQRAPFVGQLMRQTGKFLITDPKKLPGFLEGIQTGLKADVVGKAKPVRPGVLASIINLARRAVTPEGFEEDIIGFATAEAIPPSEPASVLAGAEERRQQASLGVVPSIPLPR